MKKGELDLSRQIISIPHLEKDQVIIAKVILNSFCLRRNYWFRQREVFEDARWRIDFSEDVAVVRDYPEVTILDCLDDLVEIANAEIIDIGVESPLLGRFHHLVEEVCSLATNTQSNRWNYFPDLFQGIYGQIEAIAAD